MPNPQSLPLFLGTLIRYHGDTATYLIYALTKPVLGDSREGLDSPFGHEDEDEEEKLLRQAIALSLEGAEENENEEEDNSEQDEQQEDGEEQGRS